MVRILISYVIPLLLPTVMYFLWVAWVRRKIMASHSPADSEVTPEEVAAFEIRTPWFRLILAGAVLVLVTLVLGVFLGPKNPPDSVYQPPRIVDGKIVPGEYVPKQP